MNSEINKVICDTIDEAVQKKIKTSGRDITYPCVVTKVYPKNANTYELTYQDIKYVVTTKNIKLNLYDNVHLFVPQGDFKNKFVLEDLGGEGGGGTTEVTLKPLTFTGAVNATYDGTTPTEVAIPEKAPNPQKLKFSGAVTGEYDGSSALTVEIPTGGSGGGGVSGDYLAKNNPTGTGSFSLNRKASTTIGDYSVAEGIDTIASGKGSHAEGAYAEAKGDFSHAEGGYDNYEHPIASAYGSHAEGYDAKAYGNFSHAEGCKSRTGESNMSPIIAAYAHAEGYATVASGRYSHAEGVSTVASNDASHAEGNSTIASYLYSHAEGMGTTASGRASHAEGYKTIARGSHSHAEGFSAKAYGSYSHAEGSGQTGTERDSRKAPYAHAEGEGTIASGQSSHAEGEQTTANGDYSHTEGGFTTTNGSYSHASGYYTTALDYQTAIGKYNNTETATTDTAFVVGNGSGSSSKSNAFRVQFDGQVFGHNSYNSTGTDYAEYFEWADGNADGDDRRGYFVTLDGDKIKIAEKGDYILGVVSALPSVIGNADEDWMGRYVLDDFGGFIPEEYEYEEKSIDPETGKQTTVTKTGTKWKENPDYDPKKAYTQRADRKEWAAVGMLGVLAVRDDGTCKVNRFCELSDGGTATAAENGYRVIKRVSDNVVKIILK